MGTDRKPRLLVVNIYFSPQSFGGATIVAEETAKLLGTNHGWDVVVLTSISDNALKPYGMRRYSAKGMDVIGIKLPRIDSNNTQTWHNPQFDSAFELVLDTIQPDVVHFHSIQSFGGGVFEACQARAIPFAATLHDCWFLCERQFMINRAGQYCFQDVIDHKICRYCVADITKTASRDAYLRKVAGMANLLLYPSEFHRALHLANGLPETTSRVNKNGVRLPVASYKNQSREGREKDGLRFGFIGGPGPIKGADVMAKAFQSLKGREYELIVVDAAQNVGQSWAKNAVWSLIPGKVTFVPPYDQASMDDFFAGIDVLLFPSQWKESFGLTVREAIVRDVWVISTDAGGVTEDLIAGENADVIPLDGNPATLAAAIERVLDNPPPQSIRKEHIVSIDQQTNELDGYLRSILKAR